MGPFRKPHVTLVNYLSALDKILSVLPLISLHDVCEKTICFRSVYECIAGIKCEFINLDQILDVILYESVVQGFDEISRLSGSK